MADSIVGFGKRNPMKGYPIVNSGYILAIGGLSESNHTTLETWLPVLGNISILEHAFRSKKGSEKTRRNFEAYYYIEDFG